MFFERRSKFYQFSFRGKPLYNELHQEELLKRNMEENGEEKFLKEQQQWHWHVRWQQFP